MTSKSDNNLTGKTTIEFVRLGAMGVAPHCQRELIPGHVSQLLKQFDLDKMGVLVLSKHADDLYLILDGQQRRAALIEFLGSGWECQRVQCQVYHGLTRQEESGLFVDLNYHRLVRAWHLYRVSVQAGREPYVSIEAIVHACGLRTGASAGPGVIAAVSALQKVYKRGGPKTLAKTLRLIMDSYGETCVEGDIIEGIGLLCQRYDDALDFDRAVAALGNLRGGVSALRTRARVAQQRYGGTIASALAAVAVIVINAAKGGKKLPSWYDAQA